MNFSENLEILDVVNSAQRWHEIRDFNVYTCPTEGSAYNHKRCKYLGMYKDKRVSAVAEIEAVIDVYSEDLAEINWINGSESVKAYVKNATDLALKLRKNSLPQRLFLLKDLSSTDFVKDSKGGMFGSKRYFDIEDLSVTNASELAEKLRGKTWSELETAKHGG